MRSIVALLLLALASGAAAQDRAWIEASDRYSNQLLGTLGAFFPEWMSELGLERYDTEVRDLQPRHTQSAAPRCRDKSDSIPVSARAATRAACPHRDG